LAARLALAIRKSRPGVFQPSEPTTLPVQGGKT
jgi:hypothetical protein